jgi:hypothetical protein
LTPSIGEATFWCGEIRPSLVDSETIMQIRVGAVARFLDTVCQEAGSAPLPVEWEVSSRRQWAELIDVLSEHREFWGSAVSTHGEPFEISVEQYQAVRFDELSYRMHEPARISPEVFVDLAEQVTDLSARFAESLPGDPTIRPPRPRPR